MNRLRAVLLDAGGTLIHPDHEFILDRLAVEGVEADTAAYEAARGRADTVVRDRLRSDDPGTDADRIRDWFGALLMGLGLPEDRLEAVGAALRQRHQEGRLWTRAAPGTLETLRELREAGLRLAVVSNADGRVAEYLAGAGLSGAFDLIVDSGSVGIEKPDPRIFALALDRLGVDAGEAVHVGDSWEIDVEGARAAGIRPVYLGVQRGDGDVACIPSIDRLPTVLSGQV
jgi:HAD superfamily hydrolase (TIGR01549 family)